MQSLIIFALGLSVGSFLNVLIVRVPNLLRSNLKSSKGFDLESARSDLGSIISGHSKCPGCGHILAWYDLFPVLSFIFLRGRCRYCQKKISFRYPLVELLTGLQFTVFSLQFLPTGQADLLTQEWLGLVLQLAVTSLLTALLFIDLEHFIIPDKILIVLGLLSLPQIIRGDTLERVLAGVFAGLFFLIVYLITKGKAIGLGDVKLIFVLGLLLGFPGILLVIYFSLIAGTLWGLALIIFFGAKLKTKIPFGTVLASTTIFYIIFGKFFTPFLMPYIFRLYV